MERILLENVEFTDPKLIGHNYNALELSVSHQKTCYNWATGDKEIGGIYVNFRPMQVSENCQSFVMFDNSAFKIRVQELERKSQKKINTVLEKVNQHKNLLLDLFKENRRQDIFNLVKSFTA